MFLFQENKLRVDYPIWGREKGGHILIEPKAEVCVFADRDMCAHIDITLYFGFSSIPM